jgi:hypothetical protein
MIGITTPNPRVATTRVKDRINRFLRLLVRIAALKRSRS